MSDTWIAVASAALDVRGLDVQFSDVDYLVLALYPAEPIGLNGIPAALWKRLIEAPLDDTGLDRETIALLHEFEDFGIASQELDHPARIRSIEPPRLSSPMHEMVYGLVGTLGRMNNIDLCFIKGPLLHFQGLREREHSGDVDLWVHPRSIEQLVELLSCWGWRLQPGVWDGTHMNHSVTMDPGYWGCQLDLHEHFPGSALPHSEAYEVVRTSSDVHRLASVEIQVPNMPMHAVISALHALRPEIGQPITQPYRQQQAVALLQKGGEPSFTAALRLGAGAALEPALRHAFPEKALEDQGPLPLNWVWRTKRNLALAYLTILRGLPPGQKMHLLFRAIWPPAPTVRASDEIAGGGGGGTLRMRLRRIKRGIDASFRRNRAKRVQ